MAFPETAGSGDLALGDLDCDAFERDLLPVIRNLLDAARRPEGEGWHLAFAIAAERWGETPGPGIAWLLQKVLRAILRVRPAGLAFQPPLSVEARARVTRDEWLLVLMLHHMRRGQTARARDLVWQVTEGRMDPDVIRAALAFAARFSCGPVAGGARRPHLRVVR